MPQIDNPLLSLVGEMDDELKVKLARLAVREGKTVEELVISFLSEGVNTYPGFLASYAKQG